MSGGLRVGKGSKRGVRRIHWSRGQAAFVVLLLLSLGLVAFAAGVWVSTHHLD